MADARISDDMVLRIARSVNAILDVREQADDDLKVTWADVREELKAAGLKGAEVSLEVSLIKAAIAETRKSEMDKAKADAKAEGVEGYIQVLNSPLARARTREAAE